MLTIEEKIRIIQDQSKKHDITSYEYGNSTTISLQGAQNVLDGKA